jgi:hypothetical protein
LPIPAGPSISATRPSPAVAGGEQRIQRAHLALALD